MRAGLLAVGVSGRPLGLLSCAVASRLVLTAGNLCGVFTWCLLFSRPDSRPCGHTLAFVTWSQPYPRRLPGA